VNFPVGSYTITVTAANAFGSNQGTGSLSITNSNGGGNCSATSTTPSITNVYASPSTITNGQSSTVSYTLNTAANVTVQVLNSNGTVIRTLASSICNNSGTGSYSWNGIDTTGNMVPSGQYTVRIDASNGSGSDSEYTYITVNNNGNCNYNTTNCNCPTNSTNCNCTTYNTNCNNNCNYTNCAPGTLIQNLYVAPEIFNPRQNQTSTVYYNLNQSATVTTQILDRNGVVIRTLVDNMTRYSNNYAYTTAYGSYNYADLWNGRDVNGNIVPDNIYQFRVTANGNGLTDTKTAWVEVDTDGIIIGFPNGSTCGSYIDVSSNSPYCKAIQLMTDNGVFTGYSDHTFRPYQQINRAETVKVILLALSIPVNNTAFTTLFSDTDSNAWYGPYLRTAKMLGIIRGYPDGTFRPNQTVNRVELLKVFLESSGVNVPYCNYAPYNDTPVNADTRWYIDYACYSKSNNLMHDDGAGKFSPAAPMTRGDVADLFYQFDRQGLYNKNNNPYYNGTCTYNNNCAYNNCINYASNYNNTNCNTNCAYNTVNCNTTNCAYNSTNCNNCTYNTVNCNCTSTVYNNNCNYVNNTGVNTPVINSLTASPSTFNPYNGGTTNISYALNTAATSVYIQITDSNNTVRRTIYNGGTTTGYTNTVSFDGRDTNGNILPTGTYIAKVNATNSYGTGISAIPVYISTNGTSNGGFGVPNVNNVFVSPSTFNPASQSATITYSLSQQATSAYVQILNINNVVVRTIQNTGTSATATDSLFFNGNDNNGNRLASGSYTVRVNATNNYGTGVGTANVYIQ